MAYDVFTDLADVPEGHYIVTKEQGRYLRKMLRKGPSLVMTDEIVDSLKLIERTLKDEIYDEWDKEELNKINKLGYVK